MSFAVLAQKPIDNSSPTNPAELTVSPTLGCALTIISSAPPKHAIMPKVLHKLTHVKSSKRVSFQDTSILTKSESIPKVVRQILNQEKFVKLKISFNENPVASIQVLEKENSRHWGLFPICCPSYPEVRCFQEINSLKEAHILLDGLYDHPCISRFIPLGSGEFITGLLGATTAKELKNALRCLYNYESSGSKEALGDVSEEEAEELLKELREDAYQALGATYEAVKLIDRSVMLNWFCCLYLLSIKDTPGFYEDAAIQLRDKLDFKKSDHDIFWQEYEEAAKEGNLNGFVHTLSKLIPLDVFARLRLDADLLSIINKQVEKPLNWKLPTYTAYENQMQEVRKIGKSITDLDLSEIQLRGIPPELSNILRCNLGNNYSNIPDSVFAQLSNLAYLAVSFDQSDEDFANYLLDSIKQIDKLEELDLSAASVELEEISDILEYAIDTKISIVLPMPERERDLIAVMDRLGLEFPETSPDAQNRYFTGTQESLDKLKESNKSHYQALLDHLRSPANVSVLSELIELDLSDLPIRTLPEEICELEGVESVIFDEGTYDMIGAVFTLPNLKTIQFSDPKIEEKFPNLRSICNDQDVTLVIKG